MKHTYKVIGMTCNGCRSHVEKTLAEVSGVSNVEVSLEKQEAVIEMEKHIPLETFQKKLEDDSGGYSISVPSGGKTHQEKRQQIYAIHGMTCNGCRSHVEKTLAEVSGVSNVEVNLEKAEAVIEMEKHIPLETFQKKLEEDGGGYSISVPSEGKDQQGKMQHTYAVHGMTCNGCRSHVEKTLAEVSGVSNVEVSLEKQEAIIEMEKHIPLETFQKKLEEDGGGYSISVPSGGKTHQEKMQHTYAIHGMTCNGCRSHVEKTLAEVSGVSNVEVNLEKAEAVIEMEKHIPLETFQKKLEEDGGNYRITAPSEGNEEEKKMQHTYAVHGMTCNGCRSHVEKALNEIPGVSNVEVDLEKHQAVVEKERHVPLKDLQKKLEEDGGTYSITMQGEKPKASKKKKPGGTGSGTYYCPMHCEGDKT